MPGQTPRRERSRLQPPFLFKGWTRTARIVVHALFTAVLVAPGPSQACRPRIISVEEYKHRDNQTAAALIGTVVGVESIKPSPGATWLVTLKVERNFLSGQPGDTVVVRSQERDNVDSALAGCHLSTKLDAAMGDRWLVLGRREAGLIIPNTWWSRRVPVDGLDTSLRKRLEALRDTRDAEE